MQGGSDTTFTAEASLSQTTVRKAWSRPPISIDFQVLMFTASGLLVRFLKVFEKSNYQSVKVSRFSDGRIILSLLFGGVLTAFSFLASSGCDVSHSLGEGNFACWLWPLTRPAFLNSPADLTKANGSYLIRVSVSTASLAPVHVH